MINIRIVCRKNDFREFHSAGHANFNTGNDIVCSAVSALSYALLGTLSNIPGLKIEKEVGDGKMDIFISSDNQEVRKIANTVFSTITIGVRQIAGSYPDNVVVDIVNL